MRRSDREVKNPTEIENILQLCKTCHIAMSGGEFPYIVPMSYGYRLSGGVLTLYFHSASAGRKIDLLRENPLVCFEISSEGELLVSESPCRSGYSFSSIIGNGKAFFVENSEEKRRALSAIYLRQTGLDVVFSENQAASVCVFKIVSTDFSGKKK